MSGAGTAGGTDAGSARSTRALARLYVAVSGFSGAAVMLVELAGIRLLSPVFGNSLDTWTALICVVLVALSVGNALGGYLADRPRAGALLSLSLLLSGALTMLLPAIAAVLSHPLGQLGSIAGPLALSLALFALPAVAFGTMSPLALRLLSRLSGDRRVGLAAGVTNASSAIGSFVGTVATGYVLMRLFGIREIYLFTALALLALGLLSARMHRVRLGRERLTVLGLGIGLAALGWVLVRPVHSEAVVATRATPYQNISVLERTDEDGLTTRMLVHDRALQGQKVVETGALTTPYQRAARLIELHREELGRVAVLGGGMFGVPQLLSPRYPEARFDVLEIDPAVIEIAHEWFDLGRFPRIDALALDGRRHLAIGSERYDLIYLDAYGSLRTIPEHLLTREFFAEAAASLDAADGVVMVNLIARLDPSGDALYRAVRATIGAVFGRVDVYRAADLPLGQIQNLVLLAGPGLAPREALEGVDEETRALLARRVPPPRAVAGREPLVLSDDYAPVRALVAQMER